MPTGIEEIGVYYIGSILALKIMRAWSGLDSGSDLPDPPGNLIFEDNFDGSQINMNKWENVFGDYAWLDIWKNCAKKNHLSVSDSNVRLKFSNEEGFGKSYTGTGLERYSGQNRGRWEVKAKFPPSGSGVIGYIALYPEPNNTWPPEIDFAETVCSPKDCISFTQHWKNSSGQHESEEKKIFNFDETSYHIYTIDVVGSKLNWYIDGKLKESVTNMSPNSSWFFTCGILSYCDSISTSLPVYMDIDYVKIYSG